jgi:hypothetical protein
VGQLEDITSRQGIVDSMVDVEFKQYLFVRNMWQAATEHFGDEAVEPILEGLRQLGKWRGEYIRWRPDTQVRGRSITTFLDNWDGNDLALGGERGDLTVEAAADSAVLRFDPAPGSDYYGDEGKEILERYWRTVFEGMAGGFDPDMSVDVALDNDTLAVRWHLAGTPDDAPRDHVESVLGEPAVAIERTRRASMSNGALYMFIARELIKKFDAAGEVAVRDGVRRIARERAELQKARHTREGKEFNLKNLMEDWDGPLVSAWTFNDGGYLSESTWHGDCNWCPYAAAWQEFGHEGLDLGLLYDVELHTELYRTYHPGAIVKWDQLKTRGDALCQFRIHIPELVKPGEPAT